MNKPVGYSSDDPEAVRQEQLRMIQAKYDNPKYKADRPALAREIARLGGTVTKAVSPLSQPAEQQVEVTTEAPVTGALGAPAPVTPSAPVMGALVQRQAPDIAELLKQYVPQDDSQSRYLALAQGFGAGTRHGTFGEQVANVAGALQSHKQEQEKLRSQYVPLIMQQVAKQQAMEEQAAIRREQQQFQIQESQRAQAAKIEADKALQAEKLAASAAQDARNETLRRDLANQQEALRRDISGSRPEPAPHVITNAEGVFTIGRDGRPAAVVNPLTGKPMMGNNEAESQPTPVLGVPVPTVLPWANQANVKDRDKVRAAEIQRGGKEIEADNDLARNEMATMQQAARFKELNAKLPTGGFTDKFKLGQWVQSFGPEYADMQAISAELVPRMRVPGSGTTSDFDARMFERSTLGVDKPKETNDAIATALIERAKLSRGYADFRNAYLEQNGTLQGANRYWNQYVEKNPIFDPKKPNTYVLNENRQNWRDFFKTSQGKPDAGGDAPKTIANDADYNALPSGAMFVGPDGKTRRKP